MTTRTTKSKSTSRSQDSTTDASDRVDEAKHIASEKLQTYGSHYVAEPARDIGSQFLEYAKRKPEVAAMWCFGLGVMVGWKLRG